MKTEYVVKGEVTPDGALKLDEKLELAPGRVEVAIKPVAGRSAKSVAKADNERRKRLWKQLLEGREKLPRLPDEAFKRESFYGKRG